jgi:hypothetical protein
MSERSKKLAHYIRRAKERQSTTSQNNRVDLLDKGFAFLKIDLEREFHNQINDVNHEPGCVGTFGCAFSSQGARVFKVRDEEGGLTIDFNPDERTAEIKGKEPINFYYFIQTKLAKDETKWCCVGGEKRTELAPINCKLDIVVEQALLALCGIDA